MGIPFIERKNSVCVFEITPMQWFFDKMPLRKIAKKLDTSEGYIKKRKFICKEKLIKAIKADAIFNELKNA